MGELAFRKVQYGVESSRGTAVAATKMFPGAITVPADRKPVFPVDATGLRVASQRSVIHQLLVDGATLAMPEGCFQKLPFLFSMGLKGSVTAAEQTGGQGDYLWDFSHSLSAANNPQAFTLEYGDDTQAYEIEYCLARRYRISGRVGADEPVSVETEIFGRQITPTTFTGSLAYGTLTPMIANTCKFYQDTTWANLGVTQKTNLLREFQIEILTGLHPKFMADGQKYFSIHGEGVLACLANFVFEGNSTADGYFDDYQAGTTRAIRLSVLGPQIGSGTTHSLIIDMFGTFEEVIPLSSDADGNNLHSAVFHTHSDALATPHHFAVKVTTSSNAV